MLKIRKIFYNPILKNLNLLNIFNYKLFTCNNKTYLSFVDTILNHKEFKENVTIKYLDIYESSNFYNEIFCITKDGQITFLHHQNLIKFIYDKNSLPQSIKGLININIKNQQTYELIQVLVNLQVKFIYSNNKQDLKYFSHQDVLLAHKEQYNSTLISPNISTISNKTFYRDKDNKILNLNFLIPKQHFILYIKIKYILNIYPLASDKELSYYLFKQFNIKATIYKVYNVRKRYFIPSKSNRINELYLEYEKSYSIIRELTYSHLIAFHGVPCVYELLSYDMVKYNYKSSKTVYIGSTNNLKRRLTEYIRINGHTQRLKDFILNNKVYFRFIKNNDYVVLEKNILDAFYTMYGNYPLLNINRIL